MTGLVNNQRRLGVITNDPHEVFQRLVINGIQEIAAENGYALEVYTSAENPRFAHSLVPEYDNLSGLLCIANAAHDELLAALYAKGKPISLISHQSRHLPIPVVSTNNLQGIAELLRHMVIDCNRRNLVFIRGLLDQNDGREREIAFRQDQIRYDLNIPDSHYVRGDFSAEVAASSMRAFIQSGEHFDGIIASDYLMAISAVETLRAAGIRVPEDVSVAGFGDAPEAEAFGLSTVAASVTELGACAARQLIAQIKGLRISGITLLSVRLVIRQTSVIRP